VNIYTGRSDRKIGIFVWPFNHEIIKNYRTINKKKARHRRQAKTTHSNLGYTGSGESLYINQ
jgi:hypothetical protein